MAVILERIDQLAHNLARVHNLRGSFDGNHKNFKFVNLPIVSIVFYCFAIIHFYSNFDTPLEVQDVY